MQKASFVLITTLATAAVVAVGTSAFAVAVAPPDIAGQVQDLPAIVSGAWSPVEYDVNASAAGGPIAVAGPVAEPIGQHATEERTTDTSDENAGQDSGTGDPGTETPTGGTSQSPGGGSGDDTEKDKADKEEADKEAKDKADKEKKDTKDKKDESDDQDE